jgi:type I restriction enzyme S subunit
MPCKYSLENYEIIVGQIFNLAENNSYENDTLTSIRNTLLPKLMSGEIRVPIKSGGEVS